MYLSYPEAEYLAMLFDASLKQAKLITSRIGDFEVSQAFMGNEINPEHLPEEDLLQQFSEVTLPMVHLRKRIKREYGL